MSTFKGTGHYRYYDPKGNFIQHKHYIHIKNVDFHLTYYHRLSKNTHWFLKPGIEYEYETYHHPKRSFNLLYIGARAGAGYNINNDLTINAVMGSRFYDVLQLEKRPIKFLFNINAEYTF